MNKKDKIRTKELIEEIENKLNWYAHEHIHYSELEHTIYTNIRIISKILKLGEKNE